MRHVLGLLLALLPTFSAAEVMILNCNLTNIPKYVVFKIDGLQVELISPTTSELTKVTRSLTPDGIFIFNYFWSRTGELFSATTLTPSALSSDRYDGSSYDPSTGKTTNFTCTREGSLENKIKNEVLQTIEQLDQFAEPESIVAAFALDLKPKPTVDLNKARDTIAFETVKCWNVGTLSTAAMLAEVSARFTVSETGKVISEIENLKQHPNAAEYQAFEALRRGILRCGMKEHFSNNPLPNPLTLTLNAGGKHLTIKAVHE